MIDEQMNRKLIEWAADEDNAVIDQPYSTSFCLFCLELIDHVDHAPDCLHKWAQGAVASWDRPQWTPEGSAVEVTE